MFSVKPAGPCLPGSAGVSLQSGLGQGSHLLSFESQFGVSLPNQRDSEGNDLVEVGGGLRLTLCLLPSGLQWDLP